MENRSLDCLATPVSSLVVFELFVRPRSPENGRPYQPVTSNLQSGLSGKVSLIEMDALIICGQFSLNKMDTIPPKQQVPQGSGILHSLVLANGLITIPAGVTLAAGATVDAQFLD